MRLRDKRNLRAETAFEQDNRARLALALDEIGQQLVEREQQNLTAEARSDAACKGALESREGRAR